MTFKRSKRRGTPLLVCVILTVIGTAVMAQDGEEKTVGWFNSTEFSLVVTEGDSKTDSFGFKNMMRR